MKSVNVYPEDLEIFVYGPALTCPQLRLYKYDLDSKSSLGILAGQP